MKIGFKKELRAFYLSKRKSLSEKQLVQLNQNITSQFFSKPGFLHCQWVHVFLTIKKQKEVDTSFIIKKILEKRLRVGVPKVEKDRLIHFEYTEKSKFETSNMGIDEPVGSIKELQPTIFDVVLVPLLVVDKKGNRLGYGGGYYDRFLSLTQKESIKVGLGFFDPIDRITDVDFFDVPLDYYVSPNCIYKF